MHITIEYSSEICYNKYCTRGSVR